MLGLGVQFTTKVYPTSYVCLIFIPYEQHTNIFFFTGQETEAQIGSGTSNIAQFMSSRIGFKPSTQPRFSSPSLKTSLRVISWLCVFWLHLLQNFRKILQITYVSTLESPGEVFKNMNAQVPGSLLINYNQKSEGLPYL